MSHLTSHLSLDREGHWSTTDDFATSFLDFSLFSTPHWDLPNSRPVHFLMLSSHLFLCLPCLFSPFTVFCKVVLARPDERETCPHHCSLRLFIMVRRSSCGPIACWILPRSSKILECTAIKHTLLKCTLEEVAILFFHILIMLTLG